MTLLSTDLASLVDWSRAQFALTAIYHWIFVPLTLGLSFMIAFMETKYVRTGDEFWKRATKFWMRLFGVNFAVGVATGLILEFEFGTNWSNYSYFVGDIFGAPLAIEGIMAFFLEATFIAVMFFGWNKVSKRFHLTSTWLTAIGANLSALWILVANAWMQYPVGMQFNPVTSRNEMVDFWGVLFSPVAMNKFFHTVTSGYILAAVFVIGVSAWFLMRKREHRLATNSIKIAAIFGLASCVVMLWTGDRSAVNVATYQPMKLAAMEGLYKGDNGVGIVAVGALKSHPDKKGLPDGDFHFRVAVPKLLSLMAYRDANSYVAGIDDLIEGNASQGIMATQEKMKRGEKAIQTFGEYKEAVVAGDKARADSLARLFDPKTAEGKAFLDDYFAYFGYGYFQSPYDGVPPVALTFYSFRIMVILGCWFILLFIVSLWLVIKKDMTKYRVWLRLSVWSILAAYIASQAGWIVAEVGRQPWTIQNLLPTSAAVSRIDAASVQVTFWIFTVLFTVMLIAAVKIMTTQIRKGSGIDDVEPNTMEG